MQRMIGMFESDFDAPIVLVCADESQHDEARMRLARVGLEKVTGWLPGAEAADETTPQITVDELNEGLGSRFPQLIDVRRPGEWQSGHAPGAVHASLTDLGWRFPIIPSFGAER